MDEDDGFFGSVLAEFPPVATAFAYGSAVFGQRGYSEAQKRAAMTDLVFVVDNAAEWHSTNLERHSAHYSGIGRLLGASLLARVQDEVGAGIYYNQCDLHGRRIKYVFFDYSCLPQGGEEERKDDEHMDKLFRSCLHNMHLLYSGVHVLILHDDECACSLRWGWNLPRPCHLSAVSILTAQPAHAMQM